MDVAVIGGGAAGMMAALTAKSANPQLDVVVLERNNRLGKKLLATGNGRCNYTNMNMGPEFFHGGNPEFVLQSLKRFGRDDTIRFFENLGIEPWVEEGSGKVFPYSRQSSAVVEALTMALIEHGVKIEYNAKVLNINKENGLFELDLGDVKLKSKAVVLAAGGSAHPASGSDGNGYELAIKFGHRATTILPSLVQLKAEIPAAKSMDGTKLAYWLALIANRKEVDRRYGDVLWTADGLSGPGILDLSREAIHRYNNGEQILLRVILWEQDRQKTTDMLMKRVKLHENRSMEELMIGLLPKKIIIPFLSFHGIDSNAKGLEISRKDLQKIAQGLCGWDFPMTGYRDYVFAQTTAGGLRTDGFSPATMESELVKGFYAVGEVLDIDGDCGGYNLQWAWSSGYVAGMSVAREVKHDTIK
ncbi:MAG: aminoacetone oxidase family FAD-binding enzyme [Tissierellia bacterium]|nr:aminoacetone oxidase family FAD-binding enzyme [Tissierellia bacterium]